MADDGVQGSTISFAATPIGKVQSISVSEDGNPVDVSHLGSSVMTYIDGLPDVELTVEVIGVPAISRGATGVIAIAWNDGTNSDGGATTFLLANKSTGGGKGEAITTTLTFKPAS